MLGRMPILVYDSEMNCIIATVLVGIKLEVNKIDWCGKQSDRALNNVITASHCGEILKVRWRYLTLRSISNDQLPGQAQRSLLSNSWVWQ